MTGNTKPPTLLPEETIPNASPRLDLNQWAGTVIAIEKTIPRPRPDAKPCDSSSSQ